jgi:hypothetical protein
VLVRPSLTDASSDFTIGGIWDGETQPTAGDDLSSRELDVFLSDQFGTVDRDLSDGHPVVVRHGSAARLHLDVRMGIGSVELVDARWVDTPRKVPPDAAPDVPVPPTPKPGG